MTISNCDTCQQLTHANCSANPSYYLTTTLLKTQLHPDDYGVATTWLMACPSWQLMPDLQPITTEVTLPLATWKRLAALSPTAAPHWSELIQTAIAVVQAETEITASPAIVALTTSVISPPPPMTLEPDVLTPAIDLAEVPDFDKIAADKTLDLAAAVDTLDLTLAAGAVSPILATAPETTDTPVLAETEPAVEVSAGVAANAPILTESAAAPAQLAISTPVLDQSGETTKASAETTIAEETTLLEDAPLGASPAVGLTVVPSPTIASTNPSVAPLPAQAVIAHARFLIAQVAEIEQDLAISEESSEWEGEPNPEPSVTEAVLRTWRSAS